MQPINVSDGLHRKLKVHAVMTKEKMYEIMDRYIVLGLWYDSLPDDQKQIIDDQIDKSLINKE